MDFREIASRVPILRAAELLGIEVKQGRAPCPACNRGGERALQFFEDTQKFKCWGAETKTWGDSVQLVAHVKGISLKEAAKFLDGDKPEEKRGFDPVKYKESLNPEVGELTDLCKHIGAGIPPKGTNQGLLAIPVYQWDPNRRPTYFIGVDPKGVKAPKKL